MRSRLFRKHPRKETSFLLADGQSCWPRFKLGEVVRDLKQEGKIVSVGAIIYTDDPEHPNFRYQLGFSRVIRRERDLEPLPPGRAKGAR